MMTLIAVDFLLILFCISSFYTVLGLLLCQRAKSDEKEALPGLLCVISFVASVVISIILYNKLN